MREKKRCRWLALLLAVVMLLSVLPTAVFAEGESSTDTFYKIVHLDCGRKYFTKDWIIALINEVAYDGYNQLQLAFGNDGLRFLLNDMSFTANGTNYLHADVVKAVEQGNANQNSSGDSRYLTQSEMDEIIAAAKAKGIEIVPLLNLPGHANAILDIAGDAYNASGSNNTLDVTSEYARDFGYAIFTKYVDYFAGKGCKFFNFGADEYANDASGAFSFNRLNEAGYKNFVEYINLMAGYIEEKQMTPRAFNDGLYYNNQTATKIDTKIQCCYWSNGWGGYSPAAASFVAGRGHAMINTHGDYYYVLGKNDTFTPGDSMIHDAGLYTAAANWSNESFPGSTVSNPAGSMFCIWCDYPNAETETQIAANTRLVMRAMAAEMSGNSATSIDTASVVAGGFNADGSINTTSSGDSGDTAEVINLTAGGTVSRTINGDNYKDNVDRSKLDETIATVTVDGVDAVAGGTKYTEASVTCDNLISSDIKRNWRAASGYYYTPDGTNYYPVYAKRSSSWKLFQGTTYTYTWGYSTTSSSSSVTEIGTQSTTDTSTTPNITVYTKSTTEASDASTTIIFTGVYPGTTYVTVGSTEYEIKVAYKTENVSVVVDGSRTVSQTSTIRGEAVVDDPSVVSVSTSGSNVTFTGLKEGTTTVTVGDTIYTVTVSKEDLSAVTPLMIEYWNTNSKVTGKSEGIGNGLVSYEIAASYQSVNSESGTLVSTFAPAVGISTASSSYDAEFWRVRVLHYDSSNRGHSDNNNPYCYQHQTLASGCDHSADGDAVQYIRYWNGVWSYSVDQEAWVGFEDDDQLVAYYLLKSDLAQEVTVYSKDWGFHSGESWGWGPVTPAFLTVEVVYPNGETKPADLSTSTWIFGYGNGKKIGYYEIAPVLDLNGVAYEVYKVTDTPGKCGYTTGYQAITVSSFDFSGTETTLRQANEGENLGSRIVVDSSKNTELQWNSTYNARRIRIYVREVPKEESLTIRYVDNSTGAVIYEIAVNAQEGADFSGITYSNGTISPNTITKSDGTSYLIQTDLKYLPEISNKYSGAKYSLVNAASSDENKVLTLYYSISANKTFVYDFALPMKIEPSDLAVTGAVSVSCQGQGVTSNGTSVVFVPKTANTNGYQSSITYTYADNSTNTFLVNFIPASNVLYEDDFLTVDEEKSGTNKWVKANATVSPQQSANQSTLYGYDDAYKTSTGNSMGSAWTITGLSSGNGSKYLTTTFTGNGFDLIGTCGPDTGYVYLLLQGAENKLVVIDTSYVGGGTLYQVPLAHEMLTNGTYTAYIRAAYRKGTTTAGSGDAGTQMSRAAAFSMSAAPTALDSVYDMVDELFADGFEIDDVEYVYFDDASALAELENSSRATYAMSYALNSASAAATEEAEVNATGRPAGTTVTIDGFRVYRGTNDAYIVSEQNREYVNVLDKVTDGFAAYVEGNANGTGYEKGTYESQGGPQNEIYLVAGKDAVTFQTKLTEGDTVQVSARAVSGTAYLNGKAIQSQTEMYYTVTVGAGGVITIGNTPPEGTAATGMLAIANLKVPADTTFETPTEQTFVTAFAMMRSYSAAPTEPDPEQPGTEEPEPTPVFTPETFKTRVNSIRTRNRKIVTLTITASTDVDHVVVNGRTYYPMNKLLVKWGLSKTYVFTIMDTAGASETRSFEIVAYNADGLASSTYTDAG